MVQYCQYCFTRLRKCVKANTTFFSFVITGLFEWLNFLSLTLINCLITVQAFVPLFAKEKRFCELRGRADI